MSTAVVIPGFNEAASIAAVVDSVVRRGYDVIVVDDGSTDGTRQQALDAGARVLRHPLNRGYGAALTTGSEWALRCGYDIVVHFDADGQHQADEISTVVEPILAGDADVTIGSRFLSGGRGIPTVRKALIRIGILFEWALSGRRLTDAHNGFRAFSSAALRQLHCREDGMAYSSELVERIARADLQLREVPVTIVYSEYSVGKGESNLAKLRVGLHLLWRKMTE